jgi:hypothetical protein
MLDTDTAQIPGAIDTLVDAGGGGGQATNFNPVLTPITTDITSDQIDEVALTGGTTGGVTNDNITVENIAQNQTPYDVPMDMSDPGASIENIIAQQNQTIPDDPSIDAFNINEVGDPALNPGSINVGDQPMAAGPFDYLQEPSISTIANPEIFDSYGTSIDDPQIGDPGFTDYTPSFETPEQQGIIDQAFSKVGSTAENIMDDLSKIPGAVADFANQTVDIFGKKINVGKTLLNAGINRLVGGPISLVFDALGGLPQDSLANSTTRSIAAQLTANNTYGYNMGNDSIGQDPFGRNPVSALGNYEKTLAKDAAYVGDSKFSNAKKDYAEDYFNAKAEIAGGVEVDDGTVVGPGEMPVTQDEIDAFNEPTQEEKDAATEISNAASVSLGDARYGDGGPGGDGPSPQSSAPSSAPSSNPYGGGEGGVQSGLGSPDVGEVSSDAGFEDQSYSGPPSQSSGGGGGGGGGGGKIVCTMMNDSYGFGSFRNKIWLKHSRDMKPEYQIGYHKIFLPLVKIAKTTNVVKKVLEHIAIHRTIDIRQESRGKTHLLGRVYRKILEPICYIVGKYAK